MTPLPPAPAGRLEAQGLQKRYGLRQVVSDVHLAVAGDSAAMVRQGGYWQPMFSVLPRRVLPVLEQAWATGERSLQKALLREAVQGLECVDDDRRLSNFNSPERLQD